MARPKKGATPNGSSAPSESFNDQGADPPQSNVPPALIAKALTDMLDFDTRIASLAGLKGAAINRYEQQGVDRELLAATVKLGRKDLDKAMAFIMGLTQYAVAGELIPPRADDRWTMSVQQAEMFTPATGDVADELRMARARKQGWQAGKKGHALESNPYSSKPGSPEFVGWRDGHGDGIALRSELKPGSENVQQATGTPKPRGRPRKEQPPVDSRTQLEKDTDAFRQGSASAPDTIQ
jgi:ribosome modulation factor